MSSAAAAAGMVASVTAKDEEAGASDARIASPAPVDTDSPVNLINISPTSTSSPIDDADGRPSLGQQELSIMFHINHVSRQEVLYQSMNGVHFLETDKEQLRQLVKGVVKKNGFDESELAGPAAERDIHEFMYRYVDNSWRVRVDIPVKDLRKMIPLLIMYVYNMREERSHRKVKGMWTVKPVDWPEEVPYCDPNNQTKPGLGKPKKDILMKMFVFLLKKYKDIKPDTTRSYVTVPSEEIINGHIKDSFHQEVEDTAYQGDSPQHDYIDAMETESSPVVPMETQEWNPARDIMQRIQDKVSYLISDRCVLHGDAGLLSIIKDLFCKMYGVHQNAVQFFMSSAHDFECTLDLVQHFGEMTDKDRLKWKDFEARWYLEIVSVANDDDGLGQPMSYSLNHN